ncbi:uncharacterized protein LOC135215496 [Macrobrachium nipponense]|uniref:uncharacterized protein LOC135215496 n=1 Tax=Macrobrachium nipponense TaxID=159736 RepID=UPI0030C7FEBF
MRVSTFAFCLLVCSANAAAGNKQEASTNGDENTALESSDASENYDESLLTGEAHHPTTTTVHAKETGGSRTEIEDLSLVILCSSKNKTILVKKDFLFNDVVLNQICAEGKETVHENPQYDKSVNPRLSRGKRDINDTETPVSDPNSQEAELPKAEPWVWKGPVHQPNHGTTTSRPQSIGNILGQRIANHHRSQPSRDLNLLGSPTRNSRFHPKPNMDSHLLDTKLKQDKVSAFNGNSRQYPLTDSYSRYPNVPPRPQQNYYAPPPFPSLGGAGASLLSLLNPLNLFRLPVPPQLPIGNNQVPYNTNHLSPTTNQLPYNTNHLRHLPNPLKPSSYDIRQPAWSHEERPKGDDPPPEIGKIKYEIIRDNKKHEYGHEFMEDSPLRDDIYVGKDGNLYIRDGTTHENSYSNFQVSSYASDVNDLVSPTLKEDDRYEEPDIEEDTFDEQYQQLLKNHNMNEQDPVDYTTHFKDFVNDHQDDYDLNSLDFYNDDDKFSKNKKSNGLREVPLDWVPTPPGRINYPSYFYVPRTVIMPSVYRSRLRGPIPPRVGGPPAPNLRLSGHNPLSSYLFPSSISRPLSQGYELSDYHRLLLNAQRKSTNYEDPSDKRTQSTTPSDTRTMTNAHGFYPGNGFFDADFPTVFQMAPFKQSLEGLSAALQPNGTLQIDIKNSTTTAVQ